MMLAAALVIRAAVFTMLADIIIKHNREAVEAIELTQEEVKQAIIEAKAKKFFSERSKQYYIDLEKSCKESKVTQTKLSRVNKTIDSV